MQIKEHVQVRKSYNVSNLLREAKKYILLNLHSYVESYENIRGMDVYQFLLEILRVHKITSGFSSEHLNILNENSI